MSDSQPSKRFSSYQSIVNVFGVPSKEIALKRLEDAKYSQIFEDTCVTSLIGFGIGSFLENYRISIEERDKELAKLKNISVQKNHLDLISKVGNNIEKPTPESLTQESLRAESGIGNATNIRKSIDVKSFYAGSTGKKTLKQQYFNQAESSMKSTLQNSSTNLFFNLIELTLISSSYFFKNIILELDIVGLESNYQRIGWRGLHLSLVYMLFTSTSELSKAVLDQPNETQSSMIGGYFAGLALVGLHQPFRPVSVLVTPFIAAGFIGGATYIINQFDNSNSKTK
jgi:hypothetical protein